MTTAVCQCRRRQFRQKKINGPILLISATHDEMWISTMMSERVIQRLHSAGFRYKAENIAFEGDHGKIALEKPGFTER